MCEYDEIDYIQKFTNIATSAALLSMINYFFGPFDSGYFILFYLMIKNHPFQNGNKRIAVMSLLYFLSVNNKWIQMSNTDLYNFAKDVAASKHDERKTKITEIQESLKKHLVDWEED